MDIASTNRYLRDFFALGLSLLLVTMSAMPALAIAAVSVSPESDYIRCIANPRADCLLKLAAYRANESNPHDVVMRLGTAVASIVTNHPQHAITILDIELRRRNFTLPNPFFAHPSALKAEAEYALGNKPKAETLLHDAFVHATTKQRGYEGRNASALMLTAPTLARMGRVELVRKMYDQALTEKAPRAYAILAELGVAYARSGQFDKAYSVVKELGLPSLGGSSRPGGTVSDEKYADAMRALTGMPFAAFSRAQAYFLSLASAALGFAESGNTKLALTALAEVDKGLYSQMQPSTAWDTVRRSAAEAYARAGDGHWAQRLLDGLSYDLVRGQSAVAGALCAAGRTAAARIALDRAEKLIRQQAYFEMAYLGLGYSQCNLRDAARASFLRAQSAADAVPFCQGDHCANFTGRAQNLVADLILKSSELELLSAWPKAGLSLEREVLLTTRMAQLGRHQDALHRLESISRKPSGAEYSARGTLTLARAEILALMRDDSRAASEFEEAHRAAMALDFPNARAAALLKLAQAHSRLRQCSAASPVLREAQISLDRTRLSGLPQIHHDYAFAMLAELSYEFARCGLADEAVAAVLSVRHEAASLAGRASLAARMAISILAEIAISRAQQGDLAGALSELGALPAMPSVFIAVSTIAQKHSNRGVVASDTLVGDYLAKQIARSGEYFLQVQSDLERRILIHHFAAFIRSAPRAKNSLSNVSALFELLNTERTRINAPSWRARATCELGFTAAMLGQGNAQMLINEGISIAKTFRIATFPLDPMPSGACGYWLKQAGKTEIAQQVANLPIEGLRSVAAEKTGSVARLPDTGTLLGLAISFTEFEHGEIMIDWGRRVWDQ